MNLQRIRHIMVDYEKAMYCGHPRQCGLKNFGKGELAVLYWRAPCSYKTETDVSDSPVDGDMSRADVVLRRSCDHGETWSPESDVLVWSNALPLEKREKFLCQGPAQREVLDMNKPEAMFFFGRTSIRLTRIIKDTKLGWTCELKPAQTAQDSERRAGRGWHTLFQIRSVDKGHTWERAPLVLDRPPKAETFWTDNHPLVALPDGALVGAMESEDSLWLYGSECQGMTWQHLSMIATGKAGEGKPCCAGLVLLPSGRLQCYMLMTGEQSSMLCLSESDDGFRWSEPRPIARNSHGPWPLRLRDGRIVVLFARRQAPCGIAAILSEDDGKTWSEETMLRDDASGPDIGDPVATELDGDRIFTAYQYQVRDGNGFDGTRFIGGSFFELR